MNECQHMHTMRRWNQDPAYYCMDCGEKAMDVEPRPCVDCLDCKKEYGVATRTSLGYCARHHMLVTLDMNVTYKVSEGACFRK